MYKYIVIKKIIISQNISSNYENMRNDIIKNIKDCECYMINNELILCKKCDFTTEKKYKN